MIRRLALAGCAVIAAAGLTSCATFSDNDAVARVNDEELSQTQLRDMMESPVGRDLLQESVVEGTISGGSARALIATWAAFTIIDQAGIVSDEVKVEAEAAIAGNYGDDWDASSAEIQEIAVLNGALNVLSQNGELDRDVLFAALAAADVHVDPFYGAWDPATVAVLPLSTPESPVLAVG